LERGQSVPHPTENRYKFGKGEAFADKNLDYIDKFCRKCFSPKAKNHGATQMNKLTTDVLIVGGGTGGTSAAIQAARRGAQTIIVSETTWLGGMLTSAGVAAPDGNELAAFQTGLWGAYVRSLLAFQPTGLDHSWVSMFSYDPRIGAKIFANWVESLPNLQWISGQTPLEVFQQNNCITGVRFTDFIIQAKVIIDGTELGDLLALAEVPHRWGWEMQAEFDEPSAPIMPNNLTQKYPVQAPTWVVILKDFGNETEAPEIPAPPLDNPQQFSKAWSNHGREKFINYGRLPRGLFMINWPLDGNDYGKDLGRLIEPDKQQEFWQESLWHTQSFARFIQTQLGRRYGLAEDIFPVASFGGGAYALHPYYRESRRLIGMVTLQEQDILPVKGGNVAPLTTDAVALGNYANDHHYPGVDFLLQPKSLRWGGRWTGTPFTIPYGCLVPLATDGLLVCEKNISVSHITNGATRLQPTVMNIGQAAGMAAALSVELGCQPRDLPVRRLQDALLEDKVAAAAIVPLFNLPPNHPEWLFWQGYYLDHPEAYPISGAGDWQDKIDLVSNNSAIFQGIFQRHNEQDYTIILTEPSSNAGQWRLITLQSNVNEQLRFYTNQFPIKVWGRLNHSSQWLVVEQLTEV
jgi:FAD dependent oxidoreductase